MNLLQLRHANRAAFAVSVLVVLAACASLVHWATVLLAPASPIAPVEVVADPRATVDVRGASSLFGVGGGPSTPGPTITDIQVVGLAASRTRAAAILTLDGKPPRAYGEGDTLSRGVRLVKVSEDEVLIERDGARHRLDVPARPSLSVLSSGVGRSRDTSLITPVPVAPVAPAPAPASPAPSPSAEPASSPSSGMSAPEMPTPPESAPTAAPAAPALSGGISPESFNAAPGSSGMPAQASMPPPGIGGQPNPLLGREGNASAQ